MGYELTQGQILATYAGQRWFHDSNEQLFVIEGFPGTGKTFMVLYLIQELGLDLNNVLFLTFMGKAANQLGKTGIPAKTIDSTIYDYNLVPARDEDGQLILNAAGKPKLKWKKSLKDKLKKGIKLIVIDEHRMVDATRGKDILSFGIPVIALGDRYQLDPPFGIPFITREPDAMLTEIMRQQEDSPIVFLSQKIIHKEPLHVGVYGSSSVITRAMLEPIQIKQADIVITETNRLRYRINQMFREHFRQYKRLDRLHIGEKVICKRNNWKEKINKFYLTNGTAGVVDDIETIATNDKLATISFQADFLERPFKNLTIDNEHLFAAPTDVVNHQFGFNPGINIFEFAYALTVYSVQGSEYNNVLCFDEGVGDQNHHMKSLYTAITRAKNSVTVVIPK